MLGRQEEIQIAIKKIIEIIYEMYVKDLKSGNITKDNYIPSFGKILKKKSTFKKNDLPNLFNY